MLAIWGCGEKEDPIKTLNPTINESVTYVSHIRPLLKTYCLACHSAASQGASRNGAPVNVNFDTYQSIVNFSGEALSRIQSGIMPPTGQIPENDRAVFQQWVMSGMPEGNIGT
jgi:uncharacterized membrane protein